MRQYFSSGVFTLSLFNKNIIISFIMSTINQINSLSPYEKMKETKKMLSDFFHFSDVVDITYSYCYLPSKTAILVNKLNSIFYVLPLGKPHPYEACSKGTLVCDTRSRVPDQPTKMDCCSFYCFNMVRDRVGKNYSPDLIEERALHKEVAKYYTSYSRFSLWIGQNFHEELFETLRLVFTIPEMVIALEKMDKRRVEAILKIEKENKKTFFKNPEHDAENKVSSLLYKSKLLGHFLEQTHYSNMKAFIEAFLKDSEVLFNCNCENFLTHFGYDVKILFEETRGHYLHEKWEELSAFEHTTYLLNYVQVTIAEHCYHLRPAIWSPFLTIESLVYSLKKNGPHVVSGCFSSTIYAEIVETKQTIHGPRFFKKPTLLPVASSASGHVVTVVGAKIEGSEENSIVYYVDPKDHQMGVIYLISYEVFCARVSDFKTGIKDKRLLPASVYAYAAPRFSLQSCIIEEDTSTPHSRSQ